MCCLETTALRCCGCCSLQRAAIAPAGFLAFSGGFAFLSDDVTDVTACDVMGECEQTECEAGCILWYGECGAMTRNGQCVIILLWRGCQGFGALAAIKLSDTPWFSSSCRQVKWGCGLDSGKGICAVYSRRLWSQATAEILDLALCLY